MIQQYGLRIILPVVALLVAVIGLGFYSQKSKSQALAGLEGQRMAVEQNKQIPLTEAEQKNSSSAKRTVIEWKTYRSEKYKFQFKYPDNYRIETELVNDKEVPNSPLLSLRLIPPKNYDDFNSLEIQVLEKKSQYVFDPLDSEKQIYSRTANRWTEAGKNICLKTKPFGKQKIPSYQFNTEDGYIFVQENLIIFPNIFINATVASITAGKEDKNLPQVFESLTFDNPSSIINARCA